MATPPPAPPLIGASPSPVLDPFTVPVPSGAIDSPLDDRHVIDMHLGGPVKVACRLDGRERRGLQTHGMYCLVPAGAISSWQVSQSTHALIMRLSPTLFVETADAMGVSPGRAEPTPALQAIDPHIERLAALVRAERDEGYPAGRVYLDSLAAAITARLLAMHARGRKAPAPRQGLPARRLRETLEYIEARLDEDLGLDELATVAGFSVSHFKVLFKEAVGQPVHRYVVERRVERARALVLEGKRSMTEIALQAGFTHPSHMARCMRRVLGLSPAQLVRAAR